MENEKISVVVPVYNREEHIEKCLFSILEQDYSNLEIIIVNDGSTDGTLDILKKNQEKDHRIHIYTIDNGGASRARNYGLCMATSKYICYIDSDDYIEKDYISILYNSLKNHDVDMAQYSDFIRSNKKRYLNRKKSKESVKLVDKKYLLDEFFRVNGESDMHILWNKMYKREVLLGIRLEEGRMNEDVLGCFDIINNVKKCAIIDEKKYYYFQNKNGLTKSIFRKKDLDLIYIWDKVVEKTKYLYPDYYLYATLNRKRANFTLLAKMCICGYDKTDNSIKEIKKELKYKLEKDFLDLLRWSMPLNRKILLLYIRYIF